jgi:pimeloyl-ACP methyl ester carboxylesterase
LSPEVGRHRTVRTPALAFHVVEHGPLDGPLILLLHGFPELCWFWRHQLGPLGDAGFHVVAPDLRGYGETDRPRSGYDLPTLGADVASLVQALGHAEAHLVGHDWGAAIAWVTATLHPTVVNRLTSVSLPHPSRFEQALKRSPSQLRRSTYMLGFQFPVVPEWRIRNGLPVTLLDRWGGPGFPDAATARRTREAFALPGAARAALAYYRAAGRAAFTPTLNRLLSPGVHVPVLQIHGELDGCVLPSTARGSEPWAHAGLTYIELPGVGHFPPLEAPELVTQILLGA